MEKRTQTINADNQQPTPNQGPTKTTYCTATPVINGHRSTNCNYCRQIQPTINKTPDNRHSTTDKGKKQENKADQHGSKEPSSEMESCDGIFSRGFWA